MIEQHKAEHNCKVDVCFIIQYYKTICTVLNSSRIQPGLCHDDTCKPFWRGKSLTVLHMYKEHFFVQYSLQNSSVSVRLFECLCENVILRLATDFESRVSHKELKSVNKTKTACFDTRSCFDASAEANIHGLPFIDLI